MQCAYCVGWCGTSTTATATPSAKAACPGASSSARTWAPTARRQSKTGCGRKGLPSASARGAGGSDPAGQARRRAAPRRDGGRREAQRIPVGRHDQRLHVGHDRKELPGTGERAHAAGQQQQRVSGEGEAVRRGQEAGQEVAGVPGIPGRRSRPRRQGRNTSPQSPTGQWWSPPRPHHPRRLPPSRQARQGQAPSAAPEEVRPQERRGVGPPGEDAGRPGQLQQQRRSGPKGRGARL